MQEREEREAGRKEERKGEGSMKDGGGMYDINFLYWYID